MGGTIFLVISVAFFSILQLSSIPFSGLLLSSSSYLSFSITNEKPIIPEITTSVYAQPDIEDEETTGGETGTEIEQTEGDDDTEVPDDGRPDDRPGDNECKEGEFFNHETEQCEEGECPQGQIRSETTGQCQPLPPCYPNQATEIYDQGTGRCIPLPNGFEHCPPGTVYDSTSNSARCVIPAQGQGPILPGVPTCDPTTQVYDEATNSCVPSFPELQDPCSVDPSTCPEQTLPFRSEEGESDVEDTEQQEGESDVEDTEQQEE